MHLANKYFPVFFNCWDCRQRMTCLSMLILTKIKSIFGFRELRSWEPAPPHVFRISGAGSGRSRNCFSQWRHWCVKCQSIEPLNKDCSWSTYYLVLCNTKCSVQNIVNFWSIWRHSQTSSPVPSKRACYPFWLVRFFCWKSYYIQNWPLTLWGFFCSKSFMPACCDRSNIKFSQCVHTWMWKVATFILLIFWFATLYYFVESPIWVLSFILGLGCASLGDYGSNGGWGCNRNWARSFFLFVLEACSRKVHTIRASCILVHVVSALGTL